MSNRNFKKYTIIMALIFLLLVTINIIYASIQEIPQPIFMTVNDEDYYQENQNEFLTISYITNKKDPRRVDSIQFDNLSQMQFVSQSNGMNGFFFNNQSLENPYNDLIGRYYTLKRGYIRLNLSGDGLKAIEEKGQLVLQKGMVTFNDGTTQELDLGRYVIRPLDDLDNRGLRKSGGGGGNHYNAGFHTEMPLTIQSIAIEGFEPHKDVIDITLEIDRKTKYSYDELMAVQEPIEVNKVFELEYLTKDPDQSGNWRFNMIAIDLTYIKDGKTYKEFIHYPFGNIMDLDEELIEDYVNFWRSNK